METNLIFLIIITTCSYFISRILVPLNIKLSNSLKIVSYPNERSVHKVKMPIAGGVSFALPVIAFILWINLNYSFFYSEYFSLLSFFICSVAILILGLLDDIYKYKAFGKLLMQIGIATVMFFSGFRISFLTNPWNDVVSLGFFSYPLSIFWFLLLINAFNIIDGLDGLAAGITVICSLIMTAVGYRYNNFFVMSVSSMLFAGNLAFLKYNFYPAKIFMGDTGSMFNGFIIAALSVAGNNQFKGVTATTLLIPIIILFIPLTEIFFSVFRRIKNKKNIFKADKGHYHHRLLNSGFSQRFIVLTSYFITLLFGIIALGFTFTSKVLFIIIFFILSFVSFSVFYYVIKKEL